jgi:molecular chaperone GrpE
VSKRTDRGHPADEERSAAAKTDAERQSQPDEGSELERQRREKEELFDRYQRLAADFENYKRRTRQERAELMQFAQESLLVQLLPILDNFHRAMEHAPEDSGNGWVDGVRMILKQMEDVLQGAGLSAISAEGEAFDPKLHEAVLREESSEHPDNTVLAEVRRGYRLHDKIVRPTLVKVASSTSQLKEG